MLKKNQKTNKISNSFFKLLVIILIIFINNTNVVYGANINWVEVSKTANGVQYLDRDSLNYIDNGEIEISTRYLQLNANTLNVIDEYIYTMRIDCLTSKFKDISVNGKKNLRAKWQDSNGDKLIDDVISESCKNV